MIKAPPSYVVDTNILVDLHHGGALSKLAELPFTLAAPDVLIDECIEPHGQALVEEGLIVPVSLPPHC